MWLLKDVKGKIKYLKPGEILQFGRKQSDIVLANDTSISRIHATISVELNLELKSSEMLSTCIVKDAGSKYGTFVIRDEILLKASKEGVKLKPSDKIKFGLQQHIFTVEYVHLVTGTSRMISSEKSKLKEIMNCIGGLVTDCHDDSCTYLTMSSATSTNKVSFKEI
ncbi:nibrin [Copidosoma floridanum]|uniref:nibrin n=1 Tax=Copidosoma floridanum TaxID=29053 RepID=UPI0006C96B01|nr:nibrin [Copidosoma floridanum]